VIGDWWIGGLVIGGLVIGGLVIGGLVIGGLGQCSKICVNCHAPGSVQKSVSTGWLHPLPLKGNVVDLRVLAT